MLDVSRLKVCIGFLGKGVAEYARGGAEGKVYVEQDLGFSIQAIGYPCQQLLSFPGTRQHESLGNGEIGKALRVPQQAIEELGAYELERRLCFHESCRPWLACRIACSLQGPPQVIVLKRESPRITRRLETVPRRRSRAHALALAVPQAEGRCGVESSRRGRRRRLGYRPHPDALV